MGGLGPAGFGGEGGEVNEEPPGTGGFNITTLYGIGEEDVTTDYGGEGGEINQGSGGTGGGAITTYYAIGEEDVTTDYAVGEEDAFG